AAQVVSRLSMDRLIAGGYLQGSDVGSRGALGLYQEGRIGYEQYAARGFAAWHALAPRALRLSENALPVTVMGQPLVADIRGRDHLTNDPFTLMGLELGWDHETEQLALRLLAAQDTRYQQTGRVTLIGE